MTSYPLRHVLISCSELRRPLDARPIGDLYHPAAMYIRLPAYPMYPSATLAEQREAQELVMAAASHWCSFASLAMRWLSPESAARRVLGPPDVRVNRFAQLGR